MMVVTCSNYSIKIDCHEATLHSIPALTTKMQEQSMNNFSYEDSAGECCTHGGSSMPRFLISTGIPPPFLDDLEEAIREAKRGMAGNNIGGK